MLCDNCKWSNPETCKVCKQNKDNLTPDEKSVSAFTDDALRQSIHNARVIMVITRKKICLN